MYDLIIVGSGPAGLAAAITAKRIGLDCLVIERGMIANTVYNYPIARSLFSTANEVELERGAFPAGLKPTREQLLAYYTNLVLTQRISVHTGEDVLGIVKTQEGFLIETTLDRYRARVVLVAIGGFGRQRKLNVDGETAARVSYSFTEAHPFALKKVLVVGGGNSAAEAALFLAEAGAEVTFSIRRPSLDSSSDESSLTTDLSLAHRQGSPSRQAAGAKIKQWVRKPLERAASEGTVNIITASEVTEIRSRSALLRIASGGDKITVEVECDHIFALIGAEPDTTLLENAGVEIGDDGRPVYDERTYETSVPGLYVAGHITRSLHVKNAIEDARRIVAHIASQVFQVIEA